MSFVTIERWKEASGVFACQMSAGGRCSIIMDAPRRIADDQSHLINLNAPDLSRVSHLQFLPDGGTALYLRADVGEKNVLTFDAAGRHRLSFAAGAGAEQFLVDGAGRFWLGYFDEGIYSGDPVSAGGLARFSAEGRQEFDFNASFPGRRIDDCYALTLDRQNRVWVCPYSDAFFVGYVEGKSLRIVIENAPAHGAHGLLVGDGAVALVGAYKQPDLVTIANLVDGSSRQIRLRTAENQPLDARRISCWADRAICWSDQGVFRFSLSDILAT